MKFKLGDIIKISGGRRRVIVGIEENNSIPYLTLPEEKRLEVSSYSFTRCDKVVENLKGIINLESSKSEELWCREQKIRLIHREKNNFNYYE